MSRDYTSHIIIFILFFALGVGYYYLPITGHEDNKTFLTISTFLFSIFTGFFISRQGTRYTKIRETVANFDGKMSAMYRVSGHISDDIQKSIGAIITNHYTKILESRQWDYHFTNKSSTLTDIHKTVHETIGDTKLESLKNQSLGSIIKSLDSLQDLRKQMVMLYQERIPGFEWILLGLFTAILFAAVSIIPSHGFVLGSVLKSAFIVSIVSVVLVLKNLDTLQLFEGTIGENSARDVLGIIEGNK